MDLCRGHMEHILTSGCTKVNARLTRDTIVVNCAPGSGGCDHQKEDLCWTYAHDIWWNCVQLPYTQSHQRAQRFGQWFNEKCGEMPVHPVCARWRTTGVMITGDTVIDAPISDPICKVVMDYTKSMLAKWQVILSICWPGNVIEKMSCWTAAVAVTMASISRPLWHLW